MTFLFTVVYDGVNETASDSTIEKWYNPLAGIHSDVFEVQGRDIIDAYDNALYMTNMELTISYMQVFWHKKWLNIHEIIDA